jgi:hypothetical protein
MIPGANHSTIGLSGQSHSTTLLTTATKPTVGFGFNIDPTAAKIPLATLPATKPGLGVSAVSGAVTGTGAIAAGSGGGDGGGSSLSPPPPPPPPPPVAASAAAPGGVGRGLNPPAAAAAAAAAANDNAGSYPLLVQADSGAALFDCLIPTDPELAQDVKTQKLCIVCLKDVPAGAKACKSKACLFAVHDSCHDKGVLPGADLCKLKISGGQKKPTAKTPRCVYCACCVGCGSGWASDTDPKHFFCSKCTIPKCYNCKSVDDETICKKCSDLSKAC